MLAWTLRMPRFLRFGEGVVTDLEDHLALLGQGHVLLVTDPGVSAAGIAGAVAEAAARPGLTIDVHGEVEPQPSVGNVQRLVDRVRDRPADAIIAVGGGSVIDAAKVAALLAGNPGSVRDVIDWFGGGFGKERAMQPPIPLFTVPTTLSGADVVSAAAVSDPSAHTKFACWSLWLMPRATFLDPVNTTSLPREVLVDSALDSLTHALEGLTCVTTTPVVQVLALDAAARIVRSLPVVAASPDDPGARDELCLGCLEAGLVVGNTRAAAIHGLSYPLSSAFPISHGRANALLAPAVVRFNATVARQQYAALSGALGLDRDIDPGEALAEAITELNRRLGLPASLTDVGVGRDSVAALVASAEHNRWFFDNNPRPVDRADMESLYLASLATLQPSSSPGGDR